MFSQQSSFRGARCRVGELRILFLGRETVRARNSRSEWYLKPVSKQRGRPPVQTGFFVDEPQIADVDLRSLRVFLCDLDAAGGQAEHVQFSLPVK